MVDGRILAAVLIGVAMASRFFVHLIPPHFDIIVGVVGVLCGLLALVMPVRFFAPTTRTPGGKGRIIK